MIEKLIKNAYVFNNWGKVKQRRGAMHERIDLNSFKIKKNKNIN